MIAIKLVLFTEKIFYIQNGDTALTAAAKNGHTDCVRLLLDGGADKEAKNNVRFSSQLCVFVLDVFPFFTINWTGWPFCLFNST